MTSFRTREALDTYTEDDWNDLRKRLMYFAYRHYSWVPRFTRGAIEVEDLVHDAMTDVISGRRTWPTDVNFFQLHCGIIRSKVSHLYGREGRVSATEVNQGSSASASSLSYQELQQEQLYDQLCSNIRESVFDDPVLHQIVELWFAQPDMKPRHIAERLGLPVRAVQNAQKRLRTKVKGLREEVKD